MHTFKTLFIDLDETLYPKNSGLWDNISEKINAYLIDRLQIPPGSAEQLRKHFLEAYGTTLGGLIAQYDIDPYDYLDFVHDIPVEEMIQPDPSLRRVLQSLCGRRVIFTNASPEHAKRVLRHLQLDDLVHQIIDIIALGFHNKPRPEAYQRALYLAGNVGPGDCLLIDDRLPNLAPAKELGMTTVLVGEDHQSPFVDYVITSMHELILKVPGLTATPGDNSANKGG